MHGEVKHTFVKNSRNSKQTIILYEDGCIESTVRCLERSDSSPHTGESYRWSEMTLQNLAKSGYEEEKEEYDFL